MQLNLGDGGQTIGQNQFTVRELFAAVREHATRIAMSTATLALLAGAIGLFMPRYYESSTRIFIDPRGVPIVKEDTNPRAGSADQAVSLVESEMRVLYSDNVLRAVVEREGLVGDSEFNGDGQTLARMLENTRNAVKSAMGLPIATEPRDLTSLRYLQRAIKVKREPQSYVIDLAVTTRDAGKSQRIADRIAEEYVSTRFQALATATKRGVEAMSGRLEELRRAVVTAEDAIERFKRDNDIVGASGRLVNEQQLAELNTQLVVARNDAAKAGDLLEQITRLKRAGFEPDALPEALRSETIARLRTQYASIRRREAALSATLMPTHPSLRQVQRELSDTLRLISDELGRFAVNARLEAERARANERTLERSFEDLKDQASNTNERVVKLKELEREAEAHRAIYNTFLTRSRELKEVGEINTALASVLSPAIPPRGAKAPTLLHLVALGGLAGLGFGLNGAVRRLRADPRLRGERQLRSIAGARRTLVVPRLSEAVRGQSSRLPAFSGRSGEVPMFALTDPGAPASTALARLSAELNARSADEKPLIMLVTSVGDYEGKTTVAVNAALAAAGAGDRVLLIDADPRSKIVSGLVPNGAALPGLFDVVAGTAQAAAAIAKVPGLPIDILPVGRQGNARSVRISSVIAGIARPYDLVVIDAGVMIRDRYVAEFANGANQVVLVARDGITLRADYQSAFEILDRGGKLRPLLLTDA